MKIIANNPWALQEHARLVMRIVGRNPDDGVKRTVLIMLLAGAAFLILAASLVSFSARGTSPAFHFVVLGYTNANVGFDGIIGLRLRVPSHPCDFVASERPNELSEHGLNAKYYVA